MLTNVDFGLYIMESELIHQNEPNERLCSTLSKRIFVFALVLNQRNLINKKNNYTNPLLRECISTESIASTQLYYCLGFNVSWHEDQNEPKLSYNLPLLSRLNKVN